MLLCLVEYHILQQKKNILNTLHQNQHTFESLEEREKEQEFKWLYAYLAYCRSIILYTVYNVQCTCTLVYTVRPVSM